MRFWAIWGIPLIEMVAVLGTRPEKIKLGPVLENFSAKNKILSLETGQHVELMDSLGAVRGPFDSISLGVSLGGLDLSGSLGALVSAIGQQLTKLAPRLVIVQGDTTSALAGAIAARLSGSAVAHVEAGLRTFKDESPWPEEMNRRLIGQVATLHFAPTEGSRRNLRREGIPEAAIHVTGNTAVDVVGQWVQRKNAQPKPPNKEGGTIVVSLHRREAHGENRLAALKKLRGFLDAHPPYEVKLFSHPNPEVLSDLKRSRVADHPRFRIHEPVPHFELLTEISAASFIISDSGGIQEEAPSLGRPVFIARNETERPEAVDAGNNFLCGASLENFNHYFSQWQSIESFSLINPYGDGNAGRRIAEICERFLSDEKKG